jgi:hypothetical protein
VATAPTRITLVTTIGVIIIAATTTINDDNGSGAYELRYRLRTNAVVDGATDIVRLQLGVALPLKADISCCLSGIRYGPIADVANITSWF